MNNIKASSHGEPFCELGRWVWTWEAQFPQRQQEPGGAGSQQTQAGHMGSLTAEKMKL